MYELWNMNVHVAVGDQRNHRCEREGSRGDNLRLETT